MLILSCGGLELTLGERWTVEPPIARGDKRTWTVRFAIVAEDRDPRSAAAGAQRAVHFEGAILIEVEPARRQTLEAFFDSRMSAFMKVQPTCKELLFDRT